MVLLISCLSDLFNEDEQQSDQDDDGDDDQDDEDNNHDNDQDDPDNTKGKLQDFLSKSAGIMSKWHNMSVIEVDCTIHPMQELRVRGSEQRYWIQLYTYNVNL